jgi:glycosyltransferase involved in cell wall biosynthesis
MNIVITAFPAWEGNYLKSTVELAKELARQHRVLYVDYPYTFKDCFNSMRGRGFATWQRQLGIQDRLRCVELDNGASLHVLTLPPILPTNFLNKPQAYDTLTSLNAKHLIRPAITKAMRLLGMQTDVTIINAFNPALGVHLLGRLGEARTVYYCYDEISAANWAKQHGARLEQVFMDKVSAVVVSAQGLLEKKQKVTKTPVHVVKNGVDFALFNQKHPPSVNHPVFADVEQARRLATPIIGYLGSVDERIDYNLLESVIATTPQYRYVFVGRIGSETYRNRLAQFANVRLVGSQAPATLPAWVQQFDVCLIPFVKNALTAGIYPLKANEYLAAGKAVVATNFADLSDFEHVIQTADTAQAFLSAISNQLFSDYKTIEKRQAFAAQNAWSKRAADLTDVLLKLATEQAKKSTAIEAVV